MAPVRIIETKVRKCGRRKEGGVYLVGGEGGSENGVMARFTRLNPPIPYDAKFHRGPRLVDGFALLNREPIENWWIGSSADTERKKSADAWAIDTFGMTLTKRLGNGECKEAKDADEALVILVNKIAWKLSRQATTTLQSMVLGKVNELARVAPHYEKLLDCFVQHHDDHQIGHLMEAQAALWRMAYAIPPAKRETFIPMLVRMLTLMNLSKDALFMQRMFGANN